MKILTVANHIAILEELEKELKKLEKQINDKIIRETDALMAGKYAFNHEVDIVFAETNMKRMNGLQLIQFVKHEHPGVKSYLIGADEDFSESFLIVLEDVTGILIYPFTEKAIQAVLQETKK